MIPKAANPRICMPNASSNNAPLLVGDRRYPPKRLIDEAENKTPPLKFTLLATNKKDTRAAED
jgi:hypothetical protein